MLMQSYDFLELNHRHNCVMELGGDDQWSNIIGGVELLRRKEAKEVYGMTSVSYTHLGQTEIRHVRHGQARRGCDRCGNGPR